MMRKEYQLELCVIVSLDDETLADVEEQLKDRVNEFLGCLERIDDIRIVVLSQFEVTEYL